MKIEAKNFKTLVDVAFNFGDGITLIAGPNGAGKTSIAQAVAVATGCGIPVTQKDLKAHGMRDADGVKRGAIVLTGNAGAIKVELPTLKRTTKGAEPLLDAISLGLENPESWKAAQWVDAISSRFDAEPKRSDFDAALSALPKDKVTAIFDRVQAIGFDAAHAELREKRTRLKGQWEGVTRERYGKEKAVEWWPEEYDGTANPDDLHEEIKALTAQIEAAKRMVDPAHIDQLKADAAKAGPGRQNQARLDAEIAELSAKIKAGTAPKSFACPDCGAALTVDALTGAIKKFEPGESVPADEMSRLRNALDAARISRAAAARDVANGELAESKLRLYGESEIGTPEGVEALIDRKIKAISTIEAFARKESAAEIAERIERGGDVIDALSPSGIRAKCLERGIVALNAAIADVCSAASWPSVAIVGEDFTVCINGRRADFFSSHAQRWIAAAAVQIALTGRRVPVWLDGADCLQREYRIGLFEMLRKLEQPAVVLMTLDRDRIPKAAWIEKIWIEGGVANGV